MGRSEIYFGPADSSRIINEELIKRHVFRGIEKQVKWNTMTDGVQVVVGIKGSGKTELRRYLESHGSSYIFNLDEDHSYLNQDVSKIEEDSGRVKNTVAAILLQEFARRVAGTSRSSAANALRKACDESTKILKNIPNAIEGQVGGVKIRLGEIFKSDEDAVLECAVDELVKKAISVLSGTGKRGAILIDDVEVVFRGIQKNPLFLEGVVRAVAEINDRGSDRIHALLFVKHGLWRAWLETPKEFDKATEVIGFITWDHRALVDLIAKRIASRHNVDVQNRDLDVEELWAKEFSWTDDFDSFANYCARLCVSGPRDMIRLCNLAGVEAGDAPIGKNHIDAILGTYSEEKIHGLNQDFGDAYPGVNHFVEHVFHGAPVIMTGLQLAQLINDRAFLEPRVNRQFEDKSWYGYATKEGLAQVMYQIGVVGFESDHGMMYAIQKPHLSIADLLAKNVCVHPAFRSHLSIISGAE